MKMSRHTVVLAALIIFAMISPFVFLACDGSPSSSTETTAGDPGTTAPGDTTSGVAGSAAETTEDISSLADNDIRRFRDKVKAGDWGMALTAALEAGDSVYIPAGTYRMSSVKIPSGKTVYGAGDGTKIFPLGSILFDISGSAGEEIKLAEDMPDFSDIVKLTKSSGAKEGDLIYLMSQRNCTILEDCTYDWVLGRSYKSGVACFFAEFLTVAEVSDGGRTLRASGATVFPFYRADGSHESVPRKPAGRYQTTRYMRDGATVRLVRPVHDVTVRDLTVIECTGSAVVGSWMRDCVIERVTVRTEEKKVPKAGLCLLRISEALDCEVRGCSFLVPQKPAASLHQKSENYGDYNIARITRSYRSGFDGCYSDFSTHAFLIGKAHKNGTSYGIEDLHDTVLSGKWTLEKMETVIKDAYRDTNANGVKDVGDNFGLYCPNTTLDSFLFGSGIRVIDHDDKDMPKLSDDYGSEKTIKLVEDLCSLFYTSNDAMTAAQNNSTNFASGEYILYSNYAHNAANAFKDVTFDMSVLPFPKYDEAQKDYITTESFSYSIYMIPMDAKNTDKSGAVMEALASAAYRTTTPAIFEASLKLRYALNNKTSQVYDIIKSNICFDLGRMFGANLDNKTHVAFRNAIAKNNPAWAVTYAELKNVLNAKLKDLFGN